MVAARRARLVAQAAKIEKAESAIGRDATAQGWGDVPESERHRIAQPEGHADRGDGHGEGCRLVDAPLLPAELLEHPRTAPFLPGLHVWPPVPVEPGARVTTRETGA